PSVRIPLLSRGYLVRSYNTSCSNWTAYRRPESRRQVLYLPAVTSQSGVLLPGPENAVPRVAQTWNNVAVLVQMAVDGRCIYMDVGVVLFNCRDAIRGCHQHECPHISAAGFFQQINGRNHGTARCQHGVHNQG